ncbi:hypothetical protein TTHERM_00423400 (macronuclear) [Tetrahymena thermophila SB210]|uniref:Uncharacterized protein n=1 Tax=Tetrahymena thermophila (strain SB210) TaxID=312017 RepID=Q23AM1_TETTS|nr:hypothetical protein TTHERM_00423400 [Tetrahymena thermophila SB210]EAR93471.1 hypothetical protein TTHERM_00423400 [Tetrahymena thermophila SB210]|eukprot:XP_001013716.1 hypothetical protein TTHERM_00423400 [Tetrahymena thermophila SB210]
MYKYKSTNGEETKTTKLISKSNLYSSQAFIYIVFKARNTMIDDKNQTFLQ